MTPYQWNIGDEVMVLDTAGNYELRGRIVGRYACGVNLFDIQPNRAESLCKRLCGMPSTRLRTVSKPILAYERKPETGPRHILDDA